MTSALTALEEQKARLVARCHAEREVVAATCEELQQSMTWWDMGYSVATAFAPKAKFLLPVIAMAAGSRLGALGGAGSLISKFITGWQMVSKVRMLYRSLNLSSVWSAKE